jgi:hypothetical protein
MPTASTFSSAILAQARRIARQNHKEIPVPNQVSEEARGYNRNEKFVQKISRFFG